MKKLIVVVCVLCVAACLAGCVDSQGTESPSASSAASDRGSFDVAAKSAEVTSGMSSGDVTPEFKELMDSYEAFFDECIAFVEEYKSASDPTAMFADYSRYMARYAETMQALKGVDQSSLTAADAAYYAEVSGRIMEKAADLM